MPAPDAAVLDANVLFPTVLREILSDVAQAGLFRPLWSARILEEWRRAATRQGDDVGSIAGAEIALLTDKTQGQGASRRIAEQVAAAAALVALGVENSHD